MNDRTCGLLAFALLTACGVNDEQAAVDPQPANPFSPNSIPAALRGGGTPIEPGRGLTELRNDAGTVMNPDEIVYTDPDAENPESIVPELRELLEARSEEGAWKRSITGVFREARKSDKPVLIWFDDSGIPVAGRPISEDLFGRQDFEDWAQETFVRLRVDAQVGSTLDGEEARKADFVEDIKKRYKVLGYPTLLVLTPSGEVIGRYRGYRRGQWEYKWGQLRQGAFLAEKSHMEWKKKLEKKGYRTWSDPLGRKFFARLIAYQDGELVLIEPDGRRARTQERRLSVEDQNWIAEEKRKRGLE